LFLVEHYCESAGIWLETAAVCGRFFSVNSDLLPATFGVGILQGNLIHIPVVVLLYL